MEKILITKAMEEVLLIINNTQQDTKDQVTKVAAVVIKEQEHTIALQEVYQVKVWEVTWEVDPREPHQDSIQQVNLHQECIKVLELQHLKQGKLSPLG